MDYMLVILSSIISGILGVVISTFYYQKAERRKEKMNLIMQLFGNRYDLKGDKFSEALNSIIVVFHNSDDVIKKLKVFYDIATSGSPQNKDYALLDLFKSLIKDVNLGSEELNDTFMMNVFNPRNH